MYFLVLHNKRKSDYALLFREKISFKNKINIHNKILYKRLANTKLNCYKSIKNELN